MYKTLRAVGSAKPQAQAVLLFEKTSKVPEACRGVDRETGGALAEALKRSETSLGAGSVTTLHPAKGSKRLFLVGLGPKKSFTPQVVRVAGANLLKAAGAAGLQRLRVHTQAIDPADLAHDRLGGALADGMSAANFLFEEHRGAASEPSKTTSSLSIQLAAKAAQKGFNRNRVVGEAADAARRLAATPPNVAHPAYIVKRCKAMAKQAGLKCSVIDAKRAKQLNMGGLLAVGAAGSSPPAIVTLEHAPRGKAKDKPVLLVGKTITFDTGGYHLKPGTGIVKMKYDKCGGMAVIGAMQAIAALKIPQRVIGVLAIAENMIDQGAYRPDDIIRFHNGVTCEVTNTDAEGRLVLADALAWSTRTYKPRAVVDLATLTGGVVTALGPYCAGLFCNDDKLRQRLIEAGERSGQRLWALPLWDEHRNQMRGGHADLVNSQGRHAHPIQGAAFLSFFVGDEGPKELPKIPWAHIDIAGVADTDTETPLFAKGPTGFGVGLLLEMLQ